MVVALRETYINIDPRQKQREINEVQLHALFSSFKIFSYFNQNLQSQKASQTW